jgi:Flp pilus assembly protein TadG
MLSKNNERGSVLVFITLMIVLLMIMVGMGLDTGHLAYVRSQAQPVVDAAALAAASAIPSGNDATVQARAAAFNAKNDYLGSSNTQLVQNNSVTFIHYDGATGNITKVANAAAANGVRVAMENTNPYGGTTTSAITSPVFLTPLFNLFGGSASGTQQVSVSATAIIEAIPGMPIAIAGCPPANAACTGGSGTATNPYTQCTLLQVSSGNNSNSQDSGWTTYSFGANAPTIKAMVGNNSTCDSIPVVQINVGCINLNNGQITTVLNEFSKVYSPLSGAGTPPSSDDCGLIPVVDASITNFNQCAAVQSWAKFCIRDVASNGNPKYLLGDLTCNVSNLGAAATNCYSPRLVRDKPSGM